MKFLTDEEMQAAKDKAAGRYKTLDRQIDKHVENIANESLVLARKLWEMKVGKLYKFGGFKTLEEYCNDKRNHLANMITQPRVSQLTQAGRTLELLDKANITNCNIVPESEGQIRSLTKLKTSKQIEAVLLGVEEKLNGSNRKLTAKLITNVAKELYPKCFPAAAEQSKVDRAAKLIDAMSRDELSKLMKLLQGKLK